jgi:hypothetical protein
MAAGWAVGGLAGSHPQTLSEVSGISVSQFPDVSVRRRFFRVCEFVRSKPLAQLRNWRFVRCGYVAEMLWAITFCERFHIRKKNDRRCWRRPSLGRKPRDKRRPGGFFYARSAPLAHSPRSCPRQHEGSGRSPAERSVHYWTDLITEG